MEIRLKAIVLKAIKYGDKSVVLRCLTDELGMQAYMVNSLYSKGAIVKPGMVLPLTQLDLLVTHKNKGTLERIKDARVNPIYHNLHLDPLKNAICLFLTEILHMVVREQEENNPFYSLTLHFISRVEQGVNLSMVPLDFVFDLTAVLGFYPDIKQSSGPYFDMIEGRLAHNPPFHSTFFSPHQTGLLVQFLKRETPLSREDKRELLKAMLQYFRVHHESFGKVKSLDVLQELFE